MKFPIACFQQPVEHFKRLASEGFNLVIEPAQSNNNTPQQRRAAAAAAGLQYIDVPQDANDCLLMVNDSACFGPCIPDESSNSAPWYSGDPAGFKAYADAFIAKWTPILAPARGKKPVFGNFAGGHILGARPWSNCDQIKPFASLCEILGFDIYPFENYIVEWDNWNAGKGLPVGLNNQPVDPLAVGTTEQQYCLRILKQNFPNKPFWAYLQTTQYDGSQVARPPTPAEIEAQALPLVKEGLAGIAYFTHQFNGPNGWNPNVLPNDWDGRTPEMIQACSAFNQKLNPVAPPANDLQKQIDALTLRVAALEKNSVKDIQVIR